MCVCVIDCVCVCVKNFDDCSNGYRDNQAFVCECEKFWLYGQPGCVCVCVIDIVCICLCDRLCVRLCERVCVYVCANLPR